MPDILTLDWNEKLKTRYSLIPNPSYTSGTHYMLSDSLPISNFAKLFAFIPFSNVDEIISLLPEEFTKDGELLSLNVDIDSSINSSLVFLSFKINKDFLLPDIGSGQFMVKDPSLILSISLGEQDSWFAKITGTVIIGSGTNSIKTNISFHLPTLNFSASLAEPASAYHILNQYGFTNVSQNIPLTLSEFQLTCNFAHSFYQIQFSIEENFNLLSFFNTSDSLIIKDCQLGYSSQGGGFYIGKTVFKYKNISFDINFKSTWGQANYVAFAEGFISEGQTVKIEQIFDPNSIPEPFKNLTIDRLNLSFQTSEGFTLYGSLEGLWNCDGNNFKLNFYLSNNNQSFTAIWIPDNTGTFNLSSYNLGDFGKYVVPNEVDVSFQHMNGITTFSIYLDCRLELNDDKLSKAPTLSLTIVKTFGSTNGSEQINGTLSFGKFVFTVDVSKQKSSGTILNATFNNNGKPLDLRDLIGELLPYLGDKTIPSIIPSIQIDTINLSYDSGTKELDFSVSSGKKSQLKIANNNFEIDFDISIQSYIDPSTKIRKLSGSMEGQLQLGQATFDIIYDIGIAKRITGYWKANGTNYVSLAGIIGSLGVGIDTSKIPAEFDINFAEISICLNVSVGSIMFSVITSDNTEGFIYLENNNGWGLIFGLLLKKNYSIDDIPVIGDDLKVLDFIKLKNPSFIFSTFNEPNFSIATLNFPQIPNGSGQMGSAGPNLATQKGLVKGSGFNSLGSGPINLQPGLLMSFDVSLANSSNKTLQVVNKLLGKDSLNFTIQISENVSTSYLEAQLGSPFVIKIGNKKISLKEAAFRITTSGAFMIIGMFEIPMGTDNVLDAYASLDISETGIQVTFQIKEENSNGQAAALPFPMGLKGLKLDEIDIEMGIILDPPSIDLGLESKFQIINQPADSNEFTFIVSLDEEIPNINYFSVFLDQISIKELLVAVTGDTQPDYPAVFDQVSAQQLRIYWSEGQEILPDNTVAYPGFGFNGEIDIFGFKAHAGLSVGTSGISGNAQMSPINWGALQITGDGKAISIKKELIGTNWVPLNKPLPANSTVQVKSFEIVPSGGPVMSVSSHSSPYFQFSADFKLFKVIREDIDVEITNTGMFFSIMSNIANVFTTSLTCQISSDGFHADATFSFNLNTEVGPFDIIGLKIGPYKINTGLNASFSLDITKSSFDMKIEGNFYFDSFHLHIPTIELKVEFSEIKDLPKMIEAKIKDCAEEIFKDIIDEAKKAWDDIKKFGEKIGKDAVIAFDATKAEAEKLAGTIKNDADKLGNDVRQGFVDTEKELNKLKDETKAEIEKGINAVKQIGEEAEKDVGKAVTAIKALPGEVDHEFNVLGNDLKSGISKAGKEISKLADEAKKETEKILGGAKKVADNIIAGAKQLGENIKNAAEHFANFVGNFAKSVISRAIRFFGNGVRDLIHGFKDLVGDFNRIAPKVFSDIANEAKNLGNKLVGGLKKVGNAIAHFFHF